MAVLFQDAGTNVDNLNRIVVTRCEVDMVQIEIEYEKLVNRTLHDHIQVRFSSEIHRLKGFISSFLVEYKWKL